MSYTLKHEKWNILLPVLCLCNLVNIVCVYNLKLGLWLVPGQTQSPSSLGRKIRIQTHGSPNNASWVVVSRRFNSGSSAEISPGVYTVSTVHWTMIYW